MVPSEPFSFSFGLWTPATGMVLPTFKLGLPPVNQSNLDNPSQIQPEVCLQGDSRPVKLSLLTGTRSNCLPTLASHAVVSWEMLTSGPSILSHMRSEAKNASACLQKPSIRMKLGWGLTEPCTVPERWIFPGEEVC